ncbi:MAG: hypothetical protein KAT17_03165 [Candidatus Aminicenantes bacterium]|nr:hypothetical protein [Candidatus Aminicenantes bacterium]
MINLKKLLLFLLLVPSVIFLFSYSNTKQFKVEEQIDTKVSAKNDNNLGDFEIISLGVECESFDVTTDNNNTLHIIWEEDDGFHYGKISGNSIIDEEIIPDSKGVITKFQRPRLYACPDGTSVHFAYTVTQRGDKLFHAWRDDSGWHKEVIWEKTIPYYIGLPNLGKDLDGNLHCIAFEWKEKADRYHVEYFYKDSNQNSWTDIELLEDTKKWKDISFFIDYQGGIHVSWKGQGPGNYVYTPSGSHIHESPVIPVPNTHVASTSIGDFYVDKKNVVHHACLTYQNKEPYKIQYWKKEIDADEFTGPVYIKEEPVEICHEFESWPSIGVDNEDRIYVSWAEMPCPDVMANMVYLYVFEDNEWKEYILDKDGDLSDWFKTAIAVTDFSVNIFWRRETEELMMARRITGAALLLSPSDGSNVCGDEINIKAEVQGFEDTDPLSIMELFVDDELVTTTVDDLLEYALDISGWVVGSEHTIKAIATKMSGETVENEANILKDCSPEVLKVTAESGNGITQTVEMKAEVTDDVGIEKVEFYGFGQVRSEDEIPPYEGTWDIATWGKPQHIIYVRAYDEAGNQSESEEIPMFFSQIRSPANVTIECKLNRTLYFLEYVNVLKWEPHPKNSGRNIVGYRIYQAEEGEVGEMLADLGSDEFEFVHRNVEPGKIYVYHLVPVAKEAGINKEGASAGAAILVKK